MKSLKWNRKNSVKDLAKRFDRPAAILLGALGLTTVLMNLEFNLLEANLFDFRTRGGTQLAADPGIVMVTIDDQTTRSLNEFSPLPLEYHTRFLESLERMNPKGVGYLVDMTRVSQADPSMFAENPDRWTERFISAAQRLESSGSPFVFGTPFDVTGEVLPPAPLSGLHHSLAIIHKDGNVFAEDKITRRAVTSVYGKPAFHLDLAERLGLVSQTQKIRGAFSAPEVDAEYFFFRYHGNTILHPTRVSSGSPYTHISFLDVLRGEPETAQKLRGKIVLVGTMTKDDGGDFAYTPYLKNAPLNPKILVHANILDAVIHDQGIVKAPNWVNWVLTFSVTAFVLWWVLTSTPLYGVVATFSLALIFIVFGQTLFSWKSIWIRESQPLVGIFLGYYLVVPYRLIREYKKRWDYQRKHEILLQVEELKTNFLSLVTHDLKTPVARIQGLAEVLLRRANDRLIEGDKETLNHVIASTDELNRFISSILELSKVESNRLTLKMESKDINQLIEKSVEGFTALARAKGTQIVTDLEPLFPIRFDPNLISKVLNNLIDNALKYSPEESQITVSSREQGDWIVISVQDQGIGMTEEERQNLFTRFYRAKNDVTTQVSGTGLGLYLTRFFVEAHRGKVEVESEKGRGSLFRIFLPIQQPSQVQQSAQQGLSAMAAAALKSQAGFFGLTRIISKLKKSEEKTHV